MEATARRRTTPGKVTATPTLASGDAVEHFAGRLAAETDPSDVHDDLIDGSGDLVVLDTRHRDAYVAAHIPGAVSLPHGAITAATVEQLVPDGAVAVTYCWGPHCTAMQPPREPSPWPGSVSR